MDAVGNSPIEWRRQDTSTCRYQGSSNKVKKPSSQKQHPLTLKNRVMGEGQHPSHFLHMGDFSAFYKIAGEAVAIRKLGESEESPSKKLAPRRVTARE